MTHNDDVPGQLLLEYQSEIEAISKAYAESLIQRNEIAQENEALRKNLEAQAKEIRDLRATLEESADNNGVWMV